MDNTNKFALNYLTFLVKHDIINQMLSKEVLRLTDLSEYNINDYDRPSVAVDIVAFTVRKTPCESYRHLSGVNLSVLMVKRTDEPYKNFLSLPGGFAVRNETLENTANRKLFEKTGVSDVPLSLLCNSSLLGRDPRGWIISCAYWTLVKNSCAVITSKNAEWYDVQLECGDEVRLTLTSNNGDKKTALFEISGNIELYNEAVKIKTLSCDSIAFDHAEIIARAIIQLRNSIEQPYAAFRLLPDLFTLTEIQQIYETILDKPLLMANFRRKIIPYVEETNKTESGAGHRPSKLFRAAKRT